MADRGDGAARSGGTLHPGVGQRRPMPIRRQVVLVLLCATLIRIGFAASLGLGVDESYMVAAGRTLSLGYFDHPPAAWWLAWAASRLAGSEAPIIVRLPFIALFALSGWVMFRLGAAVAGERAGLWAAVLLNLSPVFGVTAGSWVLPDGPLDCALLGAALCLMHALSAGELRAGGSLAREPAATGGVGAPGRAGGAGLRGRGGGGGLGSRGGGGGLRGRGGAGLQGWAGGAALRGRAGRLRGWAGGAALRWWAGAGLCAGLALFAKYSAILTLLGAIGYLLITRRHRHWLARPEPYLAGLLTVLVFSPVVLWNAAHAWASFAFQGERASAGTRFHPFGPLAVLGGEALFVLPWIWAPMLLLLFDALRPGRGPAAWRPRLLACLATPPILLFALVAAWSSQRVLFHWAAPGYLMLFPLLGAAVAARLARPGWRGAVPADGAPPARGAPPETGAPRESGVPREIGASGLAVPGAWSGSPSSSDQTAGGGSPEWVALAVRRTLIGTAVLVVLTVAVVATQVRFDWLHPLIGRVARQDPDLEAIDWTSLRGDLLARGLLPAGTVVGVPDWRDGGKIAYALGPDITVLCLNRDARQFGLANPPQRFIGRDVLLLVPEHAERAVRAWASVFDGIEQLPPAVIRHAGRPLAEVTVLRGHQLRAWPPP